ncbi:hypothetical protein CEXT_624271 [Caerostris extrusa]|uniref:Uncharacterized protein n=1 Tax=Caerostris extrusa TaxID=172846 RepID=A0AAV4R2A6_CAEEX|nr:hypothetical protein CEXT_624271 [Caerostris extrusa]
MYQNAKHTPHSIRSHTNQKEAREQKYFSACHDFFPLRVQQSSTVILQFECRFMIAIPPFLTFVLLKDAFSD